MQGLVQKLPLFQELSTAGQDLLSLGGVQTFSFRKGAAVVTKGQPVSGAYFVSRGQLRVYTLASSGKEATLYLIPPGETCVLALNSLFNNLLYPAWVDADADTEVCVVPGATYKSLFETETPIRDITVRSLSTIVFRLMAEVEQIHSQRLDQRLVGFLLAHANSTGTVRMTQQEIASHIGTTREVVGRFIADFARRGLVQTGRGRITVLQPATLSARLMAAEAP